MSAAERSEISSRASKVKFAKGYSQVGKNNPNADPTIYTLQHEDGRIFTGTRYDFITANPIGQGNLSSMLTGNRTSQNRIIRQVKGWRLI